MNAHMYAYTYTLIQTSTQYTRVCPINELKPCDTHTCTRTHVHVHIHLHTHINTSSLNFAGALVPTTGMNVIYYLL